MKVQIGWYIIIKVLSKSKTSSTERHVCTLKHESTVADLVLVVVIVVELEFTAHQHYSGHTAPNITQNVLVLHLMYIEIKL